MTTEPVFEKREALQELFARHGAILAYLFGSQAEGEPGPLSDLDFAVLLGPEIQPQAWSDVQIDLMGDLQLSSQIVLAVSAHLNAELGFERASDYRGAVLSLGRHGVLPGEFARRIARLSGFRNVLVHEYLAVDPLKIEEALQRGLDDLRAFVAYITEFLKEEGYLQRE